MELTKQVISLSLAKKLKELGVKQESLFKWHSKIDGGSSVHTELVYLPIEQMEQDYAAFTVAELGEILRNEEWEPPEWVLDGKVWRWLEWLGEPGMNRMHDIYTDEVPTIQHEAEARGLMLAYLIENNLISDRGESV